MRRISGLTALCACFLAATARGGEWRDLFDGTSLEGWEISAPHGRAWVENGLIHLQGSPMFFLVSRESYGDFLLEVDVHVGEGGNSGIQFRSRLEGGRVIGYQAEVDPSERRWAGGLYDQDRRGWMEPLEGRPAAQAAYRADDWNRYRIEAVGDSIRIYVNGILTTDTRDAVDLAGRIALQHHGEANRVYRFRRVRLMDLGRHEWVPLFDGKTLSGWHVLPGGRWTVEDGVIHAASPASEPRHSLLVSDDTFRDLTLKARFQVLSGDSGFYFRVDETGSAVGVAGFQAELDSSLETGGLYETSGRGWVTRPDPEAMRRVYTPGEWSDLQVSAHGRRVLVRINGVRTAELNDDPGRLGGHLALQLHGGQDMNVRFSDIAVLRPVNP